MIERDYEEWHDVRNKLPELGEVVEAGSPKGWLYSKLERDYFALVEINDKLLWITPSLNDMDYEELKIRYWRYIPPDPKGRRICIKIKKLNKCWEPKLIWKKED